jgi:hypothetical protein
VDDPHRELAVYCADALSQSLTFDGGKMNKAELAMLENVWVAEVNNLLPYQPSAQGKKQKELAEKLVSEGFLERDQTIISGVRVEGYSLTHAGRFYYCSNCEDADPEAAARAPE